MRKDMVIPASLIHGRNDLLSVIRIVIDDC